MRSFLLAAGGLLLSAAALAQSAAVVPDAAAAVVPAAVVKPPRLLHFSVGLGTGVQALRQVNSGTTRLGLTTGLTGIVGIGNRYEIETGLLLASGGRGGRDRDGNRHRPDGALPDSVGHHGGPRRGGMGGIVVPLKLNAFVWASGPLRLYVSGGVLTNLNRRGGRGGCHGSADSTATTTPTSTSETTSTTSAPRVALAATAGVGLEYRPCGALSVRLEPMGRFDLQAAGRTWGGGLRLSTFWNF